MWLCVARALLGAALLYAKILLLVFVITVISSVVGFQWHSLGRVYVRSLRAVVEAIGPEMPNAVAEPTACGAKVLKQPWQRAADKQTSIDGPQFSSQPNGRARGPISELSNYVKLGFESILDDELSPRFLSSPIHRWNFLLRTLPHSGVRLDWKLRLIWLAGALFRYGVLLPLRLGSFVSALSACALLMLVPSWMPFSRLIASYSGRWVSRLYCKSFGLVARYHNPEQRPPKGSLCVAAPHASANDVQILWADNSYSVTGQRHRGLMRLVERAADAVTDTMWFDRDTHTERGAFQQALIAHAQDHTKNPVLLFSEGYCSNNTAVMHFRKGAFEDERTRVHPIAMLFDPLLGDQFWSQDTFQQHVFATFTSWAVVADIVYLPPMYKQTSETAAEFTHRIQLAIAEAAGLPYITWDASSWYKPPAALQSKLEKRQRAFSMRIER